MIWCDRLGAVWFMLASVLLLLILPNMHGTLERPYSPNFAAFLIVTGTPWLLLRAVHFIFAGGRS
jgi:hypothetical protein